MLPFTEGLGPGWPSAIDSGQACTNFAVTMASWLCGELSSFCAYFGLARHDNPIDNVVGAMAPVSQCSASLPSRHEGN